MHLSLHEVSPNMESKSKAISKLDRYVKEFSSWIQSNDEECYDLSSETNWILETMRNITDSRRNVEDMLKSLKIEEDSEYNSYLNRKSKIKSWKESNYPSVQITQEFLSNETWPNFKDLASFEKDMKGEYNKLSSRTTKVQNKKKSGRILEEDFDDSDMSIDYDIIPSPCWERKELKKICEILKSSNTVTELKENMKRVKGLEINKTKMKIKSDLKMILRMIRDLDI